MAVETICEKRVRLKKPELIALMENRVSKLKVEQPRNLKGYQIRYSWSRAKGELTIKNHHAWAKVSAHDGKLVAIGEVSFFLLPFKSKFVKIIQSEIEDLIKRKVEK